MTVTAAPTRPERAGRIRSYARKLRRRSRSLAEALRPQSIILCYHSVTERASDPHLIGLKPSYFAEHVEVLRSRYRVVALRDLVQQLREGRVRRRAVALTFDDGYADNLYSAKPVLERHDVPATVFVTTGAVRDPSIFWWEELVRLALDAERLPSSLRLAVGDRVFTWKAIDGASSDGTGCSGWNMVTAAPPTTDRTRLYAGLFELLHSRSVEQREAAMSELRTAIGVPAAGELRNRPCTADELRQLASGGLVDLGAHTETHPVLAVLPAEEQLREMTESKRFLETITERPVTSFAYPFGGRRYIGETAPRMARTAGFLAACSLTGRTVTTRSDPYMLSRRVPPNVDGSKFESWLDRQFRP